MSRAIGPHIIMYPSHRQVSLTEPKPEEIELRDMAHHLSLENIFAGATALPFTAAQHAVIVAELLLRDSPRLALFGLLHNGHDAYLRNWPGPIRYLFQGTATNTARDAAEQTFDKAIFAWAGLGEPTPQERRAIRLYEGAAIATEWRDFMPGECPIKIVPAPFTLKTWRWDKAEERYLAKFDMLARLAGVTPLSM